MCFIVAIGVAACRGDVPASFRARGFDARPSTNPSARALPGDARYEITSGGCSCSVYGGPGGPPFDADRERRRLKRRGWKPPHVEPEIEAARARHDAARNRHVEENDFVAAIRELVDSGARVSLLAHLFAGSFDQPFEIEGHTELPLDLFVSRGGEFPENRVVTLIA